MFDINNIDLSVIYKRPDDSYVINQGLYHVPNEGEWEDLYTEVHAYALAHPEVVSEDPSFIPPTEEELQRRAYQQELDSLESYLSSTDWYVIRYADTGVEIPEDIKSERQRARERIDELRFLLNS